MRTVYVATRGASEATNRGRQVEIGRISPELIETYAPYYRGALFYISGPNAMVDGRAASSHPYAAS